MGRRDCQGQKPTSPLDGEPHQETLFRLLFAKNPLPMWLHDAETGRILEVNEAAVRRYCYSRREFLLMSGTDIEAAAGWDVAGDESPVPVERRSA